jgi:integrase
MIPPYAPVVEPKEAGTRAHQGSARRALSTCGQADLESWHATCGEHCKKALRPFLLWAMADQLIPRLKLPAQQQRKGAPASQRRRLELIRRAVTNDQLPLRARVTACLMLLYAQPVSRLARLTIDDIIRQDGQVLIRLGDPPAPVPEPFAALLLQLAANRENMTAATNPTARWLFPGRRAGQPLNVGTRWEELRQLGFSTATTRPSALRQLVLQAPAPVIARSLGFHDKTTTRVAAEAGGTWKHYATGDHSP